MWARTPTKHARTGMCSTDAGSSVLILFMTFCTRIGTEIGIATMLLSFITFPFTYPAKDKPKYARIGLGSTDQGVVLISFMAIRTQMAQSLRGSSCYYHSSPIAGAYLFGCLCMATSIA